MEYVVKAIAITACFLILWCGCSGVVQEKIEMPEGNPEIINAGEYEYVMEERRDGHDGGFLRLRGNRYKGDGEEAGELYFKYSRKVYSVRFKTFSRMGDLTRYSPFVGLYLGMNRLTLVAGDFIPAWGFGLISREPFLDYPFSGRYLLKGSDLIAPYTFLSGRRVRGIGWDFRLFNLDCFMFEGGLVDYSCARKDDWCRVKGARILLDLNDLKVSSYFVDYSTVQKVPVGVAAMFRSGSLRLGFELASCGTGANAFELRLRIRDGGSRYALRLSRKGRGYSSMLGGILSRNIDVSALQEGFEFLLERSFYSRARCYFFLRRYFKDQQSRYKSTEVSSLFMTTVRKMSFTLSVTYRSKESLKLSPFPRSNDCLSVTQLRSFSLSLKYALTHDVKISGRFGYRSTGDRAGLLLSANMGMVLPVEGLKLYFSMAKIVPVKGIPYGYYTPAYFPDIFPWRVISGKEFARSISCSYVYGRARLACLVFFSSSGVYEGRVQLRVRL